MGVIMSETSNPTTYPHTFRYADNEEYGPRVTAAINAQIVTAGNAIETLGNMIVTAYAQNVADLMGYDNWSEYVSAELHFDGFKPDTSARTFLVSMFREAGMEYAEVAQVVKASVRTVKNDAEKAGQTAKRAPAAKPAAPAKPTASKPAGNAKADVTTVKATDDARLAVLHRELDGMTSGDLEDIAQYIGSILRSRNAAGVRAA
jgi:hypothetical protein